MKRVAVRKIDSLGRIVLPKKILKELGINSDTELEIHTEGDEFIINKYVDFCCFCKRTVPTRKIKNKNICDECLNEMKQIKAFKGSKGRIKRKRKNKELKAKEKLENNNSKKILKTIFKLGN